MKTKIVLFLAIILIAGCNKNKENGDAQKSTSTNQSASFNPDTDPSAVEYRTISETYGEVGVLEQPIKIGGVAKAFENEYWRTLKEGMEKGVENWNQKGFDLSIEVKAPQGESDEIGQLSIVNDMINKKFDILLLSPISDGNLVPGVEDALRKDIPVINVNDGIIKQSPFFVGPKAIENGELAAQWIAEKLNYEGEVAIVIGLPKAFAARQRTLGFEMWMKDNAPDIKIVEKQNADWSRAQAKDLADIWIKKNPNLSAIFSNNDTMALGVQEAVNESQKDILVVGVDGIGEAYASIRKGELDATIDSFPLYKGQIAIEMALRVLDKQDVPRVVWTPQALIDASNVDSDPEDIIQWQK